MSAGMSKFTPGPWHAGADARIVYDAAGWAIANAITFHGKHGAHDAYGNGRLIAAAPDLYDALRELLTDMVIAQGNMRKAAKRDPAWEGCAEIIQPRVDAARAAIAKAEGK